VKVDLQRQINNNVGKIGRNDGYDRND